MSQAALIMIADDEEMLRVLAKMTLKSAGYRVVAVADGVECVEKYQELGSNEIALVILDNVMPRMQGVEAFREIRRINPTAKIMLSSGSMDPKMIETLFDEGLAGSIAKPYSSVAFLQEVRRVLGSP